jgi:hypothetical protein
LAHIADGLKIIGARHLLLSSRSTKRDNEQIITTFKTSDSIRVLLMELKVWIDSSGDAVNGLEPMVNLIP